MLRIRSLMMVGLAVGVLVEVASTAQAFRVKIREFPIPTVDSYPYGIAAGPHRNLWFAEYVANQIGRITPGGRHHRVPHPHRQQRSYRHHRRPRRQPVVHRGNRQPDRAAHPPGVFTEFPIPTATCYSVDGVSGNDTVAGGLGSDICVTDSGDVVSGC
jgi:hypothetical protein